ncbi:hypothetical protein HDU76_014108 [Blyttiomyces sp. JEL0837]|nr:hypothetical protein HDU76_014108 [Blyttiomyces sp. JEL0837]
MKSHSPHAIFNFIPDSMQSRRESKLMESSRESKHAESRCESQFKQSEPIESNEPDHHLKQVKWGTLKLKIAPLRTSSKKVVPEDPDLPAFADTNLPRKSQQRLNVSGSRNLRASFMTLATDIGGAIHPQYLEKQESFYEKRRLSSVKANFWQMVAMIWGIQLAVVVAELTTMLPFTGGIAIYARAAFGPYVGFVIGQCEMWEYGLNAASNMVIVANVCGLVFGTTDLMNAVYWLPQLLTIVALQCFGNRVFFNATLLIVIYCTLTMTSVNLSFVKGFNPRRWAIDDYNNSTTLSNDTNQHAISNLGLARLEGHAEGNETLLTELFPYGFTGVFQCLPLTLFLYTGVEALPLLCREATDYVRQAPKAMMASMGLATFQYWLTFIIQPCVPPGIVILQNSLRPMVDVLTAAFKVGEPGQLDPDTDALTMLLFVPTAFLCVMTSMFVLIRQIHAMGRLGYMPTIIGWSVLPGKSEPIPWAAGLAAIGQVMVMTALSYIQASAISTYLAIAVRNKKTLLHERILGNLGGYQEIHSNASYNARQSTQEIENDAVSYVSQQTLAMSQSSLPPSTAVDVGVSIKVDLVNNDDDDAVVKYSGSKLDN